MDNELPVGVIDGVNRVFTLQFAPNPQMSIHLYKQGLRQQLSIAP